jgi:hypothetical protein
MFTCESNLVFAGNNPNCTIRDDAHEIKVNGTLNLTVDNRSTFCGDQALLNAVKAALVTTANSGSQGGSTVDYNLVNVACAATRRLSEFSAGRRLVENVQLVYDITTFAPTGQQANQGSMLMTAVSSITQASLTTNLQAEVQKLGRAALTVTVNTIAVGSSTSKGVLDTGDPVQTPYPVPVPTPVPTPSPVPTPIAPPSPSPSPSPTPVQARADDNGAFSKVSFPTATLFIAGVALVMQITM